MPMIGSRSAIAERVSAAVWDWQPGWLALAIVSGLVAGPAVGLVEYAVENGRNVSFPWPLLAFTGLAAVALCCLVLWSKGRRAMRWSGVPSFFRAAGVLVVGGSLWALPASWSIPGRVIGMPFDWLLLTVPFVLAALAISPATPPLRRILALIPLVAIAALWPTFCGKAATEVRHQAGVAAGDWFVVHVPAYPVESLDVRAGGVIEVSYTPPNMRGEGLPALLVTSWPAASPSPCDHFPGAPTCTSNPDGTWSITDESGTVSLASQHGSRWLGVSLLGDYDPSVSLATLPAILASAHPAADHELLRLVNEF